VGLLAAAVACAAEPANSEPGAAPHAAVVHKPTAAQAREGASKAATAVGEALYRQGRLPSGEALQALREPAMSVSGQDAACVNCHKRSGLGAREGQATIPPVAGSYLFHPRAGTVDDLDLPIVEGMRADRDPYTDATLARAIRAGIGVDGKPLSYLMPHYQIDDAAMASLIAYLRRLSPGPVPGVDETVLHFATILTPDADPVVRKGVVDVLTEFVADKNHYTRSQGPRMRSSHRMMFKANRHWQLHVWQLTGPAETWEAQLKAKLAAEPVFAVLSGVGGSNWAPVHRFCEAEELPCLFPIVDLPVDSADAFENLYFSRGVLLEAGLVAHDLEARAATGASGRIVQLFRAGDVGGAAAAELAQQLGPAASVVNRRLPAHPGKGDLAAALREARPGDSLVLWLRAADIAALGAIPPGVSLAYISGRMAGLEEAPLPGAWRPITHMANPFDLPEHRKVQVDYPLGWFRIRKIPVVAQQAQADAYLACIVLSDTLNHMSDSFIRNLLVERVEEGLAHRILTGYYPRLAMAPGQRFGSKGGYLVHFAEPAGSKVVADGDWIIPRGSAPAAVLPAKVSVSP
jgi:cytochrome c553